MSSLQTKIFLSEFHWGRWGDFFSLNWEYFINGMIDNVKIFEDDHWEKKQKIKILKKNWKLILRISKEI